MKCMVVNIWGIVRNEVQGGPLHEWRLEHGVHHQGHDGLSIVISLRGV